MSSEMDEKASLSVWTAFFIKGASVAEIIMGPAPISTPETELTVDMLSKALDHSDTPYLKLLWLSSTHSFDLINNETQDQGK